MIKASQALHGSTLKIFRLEMIKKPCMAVYVNTVIQFQKDVKVQRFAWHVSNERETRCVNFELDLYVLLRL